MTRYRWIICTLLFFATTVNYIDRAVLSILKPALERELGWTQIGYGWMVTAFQLTYALGYVLAGRLIDRIGGMAGSLGGMVFAQLVSRILYYTNNNYLIPFAIASLIYLAALGIMHLLVPQLEPMSLGEIRNPDLETRNKSE
jgi:MFS family permease